MSSHCLRINLLPLPNIDEPVFTFDNPESTRQHCTRSGFDKPKQTEESRSRH